MKTLLDNNADHRSFIILGRMTAITTPLFPRNSQAECVMPDETVIKKRCYVVPWKWRRHCRQEKAQTIGIRCEKHHKRTSGAVQLGKICTKQIHRITNNAPALRRGEFDLLKWQQQFCLECDLCRTSPFTLYILPCQSFAPCSLPNCFRPRIVQVAGVFSAAHRGVMPKSNGKTLLPVHGCDIALYVLIKWIFKAARIVPSICLASIRLATFIISTFYGCLSCLLQMSNVAVGITDKIQWNESAILWSFIG